MGAAGMAGPALASKVAAGRLWDFITARRYLYQGTLRSRGGRSLGPHSLPFPPPINTCPHTRLQAQYGAEVAAQADLFTGENGTRAAAALKLRVVEHNLLVVGRYYKRISITRLAQLLDLTPDEVGGVWAALGCACVGEGRWVLL